MRFIASHYQDDASLYQELAKHFGAVKMETEPMALRAIANALMQKRKRDLKP